MIGRSAQPGAMLFRVVIGRWTKLLKIVKNVVAMTYSKSRPADEFDIQLFDVWFFSLKQVFQVSKEGPTS